MLANNYACYKSRLEISEQTVSFQLIATLKCTILPTKHFYSFKNLAIKTSIQCMLLKHEAIKILLHDVLNEISPERVSKTILE